MKNANRKPALIFIIAWPFLIISFQQCSQPNFSAEPIVAQVNAFGGAQSQSDYSGACGSPVIPGCGN